ncbi:MAG: hypothetical protein RLZZ453_1147 [Chlamydiota bacterium]|jgi:SecD/SecF fusion protein
MNKKHKWPFFLIVAVIVLTIYNILPTLFFYSNPLKSPIDKKRAESITKNLMERVNDLEPQAKEWLTSFCDLIRVHPQKITLDPIDPQFITIHFKSIDEARAFSTFLPRAGALIPFVPASLNLYDKESADKTVTVQRKIPIHFDTKNQASYAQFAFKFDSSHQPTPLYRSLVEDRVLQLGMAIAGPSANSQLAYAVIENADEDHWEMADELAQKITSFAKGYPLDSGMANRFFASFSRGQETGIGEKLITSLQQIAEQMQAKGDLLSYRQKVIEEAISVIRKNQKKFRSNLNAETFSSLNQKLQQSTSQEFQLLSLEGFDPFIESILVDWKSEKITLKPYAEMASYRAERDRNVEKFAGAELADNILYNALSAISRQTQEEITPHAYNFEISLSSLENSQSFLALRLGSIASADLGALKKILTQAWHPQHPDLINTAFPVYDYETHQQLGPVEQQFGLVLYAPSVGKTVPPYGFKMSSLYIIAKGLNKMILRAEKGESALSQAFQRDLENLFQLLQQNGFIGYPGTSSFLGQEFKEDFIFECPQYYQNVLAASREAFQVHGTKRYAILEFSDVQQRILTDNKIDDQIHEDLLKSRDDYSAAQGGLRGVNKFDVPKPTSSVFWNNIRLSIKKYFRGDERKILKWGLDLSGGKTVQIELKDASSRKVTDPADLKQGINELYKRVNKMGVSEVSIRQEGNFITLDFPGSQGLSAGELVKASQMFFHVVNEQFGPQNSELKDAVAEFLQTVWNEAVVTNQKSLDDLNRIAYRHLFGEKGDNENAYPLSTSAKRLYNSGLRLALSGEILKSSQPDNTYSMIAKLRGDDFTEWHGQTHPLVIVFYNFALEGAELTEVHASYDPSKGNFLSFGVKGSYTNREGVKVSPQENLYAWTSLYSKERIAGTPLENYSHGRGWRMAVVLNESIISSPTLDSALKDSAMISGSFTQREISQLEADLKAGSLSFTPQIVSEKNVSPELGVQERNWGIIATALSLLFVVTVMIGYYKFGGLVASIAVFFNLLIMWATLQNLQAALTLPGIAGIILTLAMAVDANVLVFERIREEFGKSGKIAQAIQAGYSKAFSAILDSNVTTMIAALVLLQFDSGPIKALAVMLLIGIASSLFTALFVTRFFFTEWVKNPRHTALNMLNWFRAKGYDFLKHTRKTVIFSAIVILVGSFALFKERHTLFGMDFRGGYALSIELKADDKAAYRERVEHALTKKGATPQDLHIRELSPANHLKILLSYNLQEPGKPFYGMPIENNLKEPTYLYELNPKIVFVVDALSDAGLKIEPSSLSSLNLHWTEVSGQMSDTMRNSALIGLSAALLAILVYITIRFEFKYAMSATLCLAHDVLFTLAAIALLHACGIPVHIDLNTMAALLTIIGYSLNDTIIVFDRIREELKLTRSTPLSTMINHALNVTLSRTLMTSGTTLLVLLPLILMGGSTLFGFALVLGIGVIFGTLSSLFIAAPLMKYFHDKEASSGKVENFAHRQD